MKLYKLAAEAGHGQACYRLARIYQDGVLVGRDLRKAAEYFKYAARKGDVRACFRLAEMHLYGDGVEQDFEQAYQMALKAAQQDFSPAMNLIGRFHRKGLHVSQSDALACDWYQKSFWRGNADGAHNLAAMYRRGLGRPRNPELSKYLEDAANRIRSGARIEDVLSDTPALLRSERRT